MKSGGKLQKLLILLVTWGLLLVFFVGYEIYFVHGQEQFLQANGFRSLAALANVLSAKVTKVRASTESLVHFVTENKADSEQIQAYLKLYLDSPTLLGTEQDLRRCAPISSPENRTRVPLAFIPYENELIITVSCFERNGNRNTPTTTPIPLYTVDIRSWLGAAFHEQRNDFDDVLITGPSGRVFYEESNRGPQIANLRALVSEGDTGGQTTKSGDKQKSGSDTEPPGNTSASKEAEKTKAGDGEVRNEEGQPNEPQGTAAVSSVTKNTYAGRSYRVFSQPIRIWLPNTPTTGKSLTLTIYGLWDGERFESSSRKIPYSTLIWSALVVVALLSLTWPLFKLRYMGNTERFNAADGWLLVLAVCLASASVTLMLLNASYVAHAQSDVDTAMKNLASEIKRHLQEEMKQADKQLARFGNYPIQGTHLLSDYLNVALAQGGVNASLYPYFDSVSWMDGTGMQIAKADVKTVPTPLVPVATRRYFRSVVSDSKRKLEAKVGGRQSTTPQSGAVVSYLEPILSTNTDEFYAVLSGPVNNAWTPNVSKAVVVALITRPLSVVDPVLPPGYRFAIIDHDCSVLFHSDSFRDLRENFCDESKDKDDLRPWLFAGVDAWFDISYQGHPVRAFMTPIEAPTFVESQPFLLVFREPDVDLTVNLAIVLVCAVLLATYFSVLITIAVIYLLLKGTLHVIYPPSFAWPQPDKGIRYVQLFVVNVALLLFFWFVYPRIYEAPLVGLTMGVAVFVALLAIFTLAYPRRGPIILSGLLICATLAAGAALFLYDAYTFSDWEPVLALFAGASLITVLFSDAISEPAITFAGCFVSNRVSWLKRRFRFVPARTFPSWIRRAIAILSEPCWLITSARKHFGSAYVLLTLSLVAATILVPCIGFFKYAYDAVTELSLKHDEMILSKRLLDRRARIRRYYDDRVTAPSEIREERFDESLDRYNLLPADSGRVMRPFFAVGDLGFFENPPLITKQHQGANDCPKEPRHGSSVGINELLEQWMARATLKFPENSLGLEMSKLGVASSESGSNAWSEMCATSFQLSLRTPSGLDYLTVASTYQDWRGLRWQARVLVFLLWMVLSFWLIDVGKKMFPPSPGDTPFDTIDWKQVTEIQKNFLVIERAKSGQWQDALAKLPPDSRLDLRHELKKLVEGNAAPTSSATSTIILDHFEFNLRDSKYNLARLKLVDKLLSDASRKLVLLSSVDPLFFFTESGPEVLSDSKDPVVATQLLDRWAELLVRFTKVHPKDFTDREFHESLKSYYGADASEGERPNNCREFAIWIKQECDCTTWLRKIGKQLLDEYSTKTCDLSREWLVNRVLDLSDSYYHVLWSGLTPSERLVLYQLATDGWTNPKNIAAIRQLERKLLISKNPMYRIMNESFRRFVLAGEHGAEIEQWQKREQLSTWRAFRFVAIATAVGIGVWLLYTQAAFSQAVVGYIGAIATLLTAVAGLLGKPSVSSAGTKPE